MEIAHSGPLHEKHVVAFGTIVPRCCISIAYSLGYVVQGIILKQGVDGRRFNPKGGVIFQAYDGSSLFFLPCVVSGRNSRKQSIMKSSDFLVIVSRKDTQNF
jgi:hypothetical protein